jgi:hypothetical protein
MNENRSPRGLSPKDGACNQVVDVGLNMRPGYCHRPDNGSGKCNVHEAAQLRGQRMRAEALRARMRKAGVDGY